jgi:hypothetical protein
MALNVVSRLPLARKVVLRWTKMPAGVTVTSVGLPENQVGTTTFTHEPMFTVTEDRTPLESNFKREQFIVGLRAEPWLRLRERAAEVAT